MQSNPWPWRGDNVVIDEPPIRESYDELPTPEPPAKPGHAMCSARQLCSECDRLTAVAFYVPDEIWRAAIPEDRWQGIFCIACFTRFADRKYLPWDKDIQFFPVSKRTHREMVQS